MSRLGKMPEWQKWFVILGIFSCSLSGGIYLIGHEFQIQRSILGSHNILVIHGVAAMLTILALGSVLPFHLKAGLKSKRKWWSGLGQLSFLSALMITGLLLYYGPEPIRETVVSTHWGLGLLFFAVFLIHIPMGLNKQARS
jgi:Eukaryotic cytochrome b561